MKQLPVVNSPTLVTTLPVSGLKVKYRPFVVKEQKSLLLAQQTDDEDSVASTMKAVLTSCTNGTVDFSKVCTADLAYFFLQLRIAAIGSEVKFSIPCNSCKGDMHTVFDLSQVTVTGTPKTEVMLTDEVGVRFRLPTIDDTALIDSVKDKTDRGIKALVQMTECIYDSEQVYAASDYSEEVLSDWFLMLGDDQVLKIKEEFIDSLPELSHTIHYVCPHCHTEQDRRLAGLQTFFRISTFS